MGEHHEELVRPFKNQVEILIEKSACDGLLQARDYLAKSAAGEQDRETRLALRRHAIHWLTQKQADASDIITHCEALLAEQPDDQTAHKALLRIMRQPNEAAATQLKHLITLHATEKFAQELSLKLEREDYLEFVTQNNYRAAAAGLQRMIEMPGFSGARLDSLITDTAKVTTASRRSPLRGLIAVLQFSQSNTGQCVLGYLRAANGQLPEARQALEESLALEPTNDLTLHLLYKVYRHIETLDLKAAYQTIKRLHDLKPEDAKYAALLASEDLRQDRNKAAIAVLTTYHAHQSGNAETLNLLTLAYLRQKQFTKADETAALMPECLLKRVVLMTSAFMQGNNLQACQLARIQIQDKFNSNAMAILIVSSGRNTRDFNQLYEKQAVTKRDLLRVEQAVAKLRISRAAALPKIKEPAPEFRIAVSSVYGQPTRTPINRQSGLQVSGRGLS